MDYIVHGVAKSPDTTERLFFRQLSIFYSSQLLTATDLLYITVIYVFTVLLLLKSLQSCPTLCDPIDGSPPGSPVPGILQARTLEWAAISFSSA